MLPKSSNDSAIAKKNSSFILSDIEELYITQVSYLSICKVSFHLKKKTIADIGY